MHLALGVEVPGIGECLGVLFVGDDAVQARVLYEAISVEGREVNLTHECEECLLSLRGKDEGRII